MLSPGPNTGHEFSAAHGLNASHASNAFMNFTECPAIIVFHDFHALHAHASLQNSWLFMQLVQSLHLLYMCSFGAYSGSIPTLPTFCMCVQGEQLIVHCQTYAHAGWLFRWLFWKLAHTPCLQFEGVCMMQIEWQLDKTVHIPEVSSS